MYLGGTLTSLYLPISLHAQSLVWKWIVSGLGFQVVAIVAVGGESVGGKFRWSICCYLDTVLETKHNDLTSKVVGSRMHFNESQASSRIVPFLCRQRKSTHRINTMDKSYWPDTLFLAKGQANFPCKDRRRLSERTMSTQQTSMEEPLPHIIAASLNGPSTSKK